MLALLDSSDSFRKSEDFETFHTQDRKLLDLLGELGNVEGAKEHDINVISLGRLREHFVSTLSSILIIGFCQVQKLRYVKKG